MADRHFAGRALRSPGETPQARQRDVDFVACDLGAALARMGRSTWSFRIRPMLPARGSRLRCKREVRDYEPAMALYGGDDGLAVYRRLIPEAARLLRAGRLADDGTRSTLAAGAGNVRRVEQHRNRERSGGHPASAARAKAVRSYSSTSTWTRSSSRWKSCSILRSRASRSWWAGSPNERGVVSAASYAARKFGVHSAMPLRTAYKLCPQAIFVEGHRERYRRILAQGL